MLELSQRGTVNSVQSSTPTDVTKILKTQKYHLVGSHSAVKQCRWHYETLVHNRPCYKQKFYGIKTHQCVQMTPTVVYCTMRCLFCWRIQSGDEGLEWNEKAPTRWDDPYMIIEGCIREKIRMLSGYKGNPKTDPVKFREALTPKHVAISLTGEPTLYPYLSDLIEGFHKRGFTTFLVSNGTLPKALCKLDEEPTQFYVSIYAPDEKTFLETCRPQIPNLWKKVDETLSMLQSFKCPTVIRLTLVRSLNMKEIEGYAEIVRKANPTYVEPKAYMHVGFSRLRLSFENMPSHKEIKDFAVQLAERTGYNVLDEAPESRIVLLSRLEKPVSLRKE